jgi:hypothetical protein
LRGFHGPTMKYRTPPSQHPRFAAVGRPASEVKASVDRRLINDACQNPPCGAF